jgi:predicted ATPase
VVGLTLPLVLGGRYELQRLLARGGGSGVYHAIDLANREEVAVKVGDRGAPDDRAAQRFEREASALALIGSEHVVRVLAVGRSDELQAPYLVMELLVGDDLQRELKRRGGLPADEVVRWFGQAAGAVELAHGVGIVHRDLKPGNLFLHQPPSGERVIKVLDFGLVKRLDADHSIDQDVYAGTPHFMAPEQVRGHAARIGPAADIWAMGMVAVSMLTGEPYWPVTTADEALVAIISHPLVPPSTRWPWLPDAFDAWFRRSCDRVAERRFPSALAQAAALAKALTGLSLEATRPAGGPPGAPLEQTATFLGSHTSHLTGALPSLAPIDAAPRPLVGREAERHELEARLAPGVLVTVTGAGGTGKTRLCAEVAAAAAEAFPGGVFTVALGALRDAGAVPEAIADALVPQRDPLLPLVDQIAAALKDRRALVVLDNFEHLLPARDVVADLRARAPEVAWLVTSRSPLGLEGEARFALAPLEVPRGEVSPSEAAQYSAVQLFVDRARAASPGFRLTEDNVAEVCEICRRLDGLPLALELAAARVRSLGERRVPERAGRARGALTDVAEQQRTIRAAIAWSYDLLSEEERLVFRRVAVCPGGVTAEAANRLCRDGADLVLASLCDSSLIHVASEEPPRYRMLETVREFGLEALAAAGEERLARRAALEHALALTEEAQVGLRGPDQARWLTALAAELDNVRAALGWALADAPDDALALAAGLSWFWYLRGHYREGSAWLEAALARSPAANAKIRAPALLGAGELAFLQCHYGRAASLLEESAELARRRGDARLSAAAEQLLGSIAREQGDYAACAARHERARAAWERLGDRREEARSLNYLSFVTWLSGGEGARAEALAREAAAVFAEVGDREGRVWSSLNLGAAAFHRGDVAAAVKHFEEGFHDAVAVRFQEGIAWTLNLQGLCSLARREWTRATAQLRASLNVHRKLGDLWRTASVLEALAAVGAETGQARRAALVLGGARAVRRRIGAPVPASERRLEAATLERLRAALGAELDARLASGELLALDEALAAALDDEPDVRAAG